MDLRPVTLSQMRYAVAIEDRGSFRRAAEYCAVSQSGLSMQVRKLEGLLGVELFDRSRKPVIVTDEGREALRQMRVVLRETERLGQLVAEQGEPSGRYRLGVIPTMAGSILPLFLRDLVEQYPRVELRVEELETSDLVARLLTDTLDAGIAAIPLEIPGVRETSLGQEPLLAYLAPGDPLLRSERLEEHDLRDRHLWMLPEGHCFRTQVLSLCDPSGGGRPGRLHFESGSFETLMRLVDDGFGATIIPALVASRLPPEVRRDRVRPLGPPIPVREIGLVTARDALRKTIRATLMHLLKAELSRALPPDEGAFQRLTPRAETAD